MGSLIIKRDLLWLLLDRKKNTLQPLINRYTHPDCPLLLSDRFVSYQTLRSEYGWNHYTVNRKGNYVDPRRRIVRFYEPNGTMKRRRVKIHTQNVERYNRELKRELRR